MRRTRVALSTAAALIAAFGSNRAEAMVGAPQLSQAARSINPIEKTACWRLGWHGWGLYPCGYYYGGYPYYGYYGYGHPYYGYGWRPTWGWGGWGRRRWGWGQGGWGQGGLGRPLLPSLMLAGRGSGLAPNGAGRLTPDRAPPVWRGQSKASWSPTQLFYPNRRARGLDLGVW